MIKIAMISIHRELKAKKLKSKMVLQVHDELVFDIAQEEESSMRKIVEKEMCEAMPLVVPVEVEIGCGKNWLEAH